MLPNVSVTYINMLHVTIFILITHTIK